MQTAHENPARRDTPLRIAGIVQVAACLLYGGFAMLMLFGLAMCNDSGHNGAACAHAWWTWLSAAIAAAVNFFLGFAMIRYMRSASTSGTSPRMRLYIGFSVVAWLIVANFVRLAFPGQ